MYKRESIKQAAWNSVVNSVRNSIEDSVGDYEYRRIGCFVCNSVYNVLCVSIQRAVGRKLNSYDFKRKNI